MATFLKGTITKTAVVEVVSVPIDQPGMLINTDQIAFIGPEPGTNFSRAYLKDGSEAMLYVSYPRLLATMEAQIEAQLRGVDNKPQRPHNHR